MRVPPLAASSLTRPNEPSHDGTARSSRCYTQGVNDHNYAKKNEMASQHPERGCGLAFIGCWILGWSAGTLTLDGTNVLNLVRQRAASSFPTAEGTITESKVVEQSDTDGTSYRAQLRYTYRVAGRDYTADRDRYWTLSGGRAAAMQRVQSHPVGSKVTVHYNPADPSDALLRPDITAADSFMLLFMLPFNIIMVGSWVVAARTLRRTEKTPGGLRIIHGEAGLRVRPAWSSSVTAAAAGALAASFVLIFVVGFTSGFEPSARAMAAAWSTVFAAALLAYAAASSSRRDLVLDRVRDLVFLPAKVFGGAPAPVERSRFFAVDLVEQASTDSEGQSSMRYLSMLRWHGDDGQPAEASVFPQSSKQRGQDVAAWLREVVLRQSSKEEEQ